MSSPPPHPLEALYEMREALDRSAATQARMTLTQLDWPAYGSALLGVLHSLDNFTRTLVEQIDRTDRTELYHEALRDHPHEALDRAVEHLHHLRGVLDTAVSDTHGYWSETQHIQNVTLDPPPGDSQR